MRAFSPRQRGPWRGNALVLLDDRPRRAGRLRTDPAPLAPHDPHRATHRRLIDQVHIDPAVGVREEPTVQAPHRAGTDSTVTVNPGRPSSRSTPIT